MDRAQRATIIIYCLLLIYCCTWVPWHVVQNQSLEGAHQFRTGYGWLWIGPSLASTHSTPDWSIIGLRLLAVTALAGAGLAATRR